MQLSDVVATSHAVAATSSRTAKVEALAACLAPRGRRTARATVEVVTAHLSGALPQRRIGVSWRGLQGLPDPAETSTLTVEEVDAAATDHRRDRRRGLGRRPVGRGRRALLAGDRRRAGLAARPHHR